MKLMLLFWIAVIGRLFLEWPFLIVAISVHKWKASLSLGISFIKAKTSKKFILLWLWFLLLVVLFEIYLGLLYQKIQIVLVEGILMGVSVGIFIYFACSDDLVEELKLGKIGFWNFSFLLPEFFMCWIVFYWNDWG